MASELFHDLYRRAFQPDCPTIHKFNHLTASLGPSEATGRAALSDKLVDADQQFEESIHEIATRNNMYRADTPEFRCPCCGLSHCSGAVPMARIPAAILAKLQAEGLI